MKFTFILPLCSINWLCAGYRHKTAYDCLCHILEYNLCFLCFESWLGILQQPDLKTPYGKDSVMAGSENFCLLCWQSEFQAKQCSDHLCLSQRLVTWWSLDSSCHGDGRWQANHKTGDVVIVNPYIGSLAQECNFLTGENKKKTNIIARF